MKLSVSGKILMIVKRASMIRQQMMTGPLAILTRSNSLIQSSRTIGDIDLYSATMVSSSASLLDMTENIQGMLMEQKRDSMIGNLDQSGFIVHMQNPTVITKNISFLCKIVFVGSSIMTNIRKKNNISPIIWVKGRFFFSFSILISFFSRAT